MSDQNFTFRTTQDRQEEELRRQQGLRPRSGNPLGILGQEVVSEGAYDALPDAPDFTSILGGAGADPGLVGTSTLPPGVPIPSGMEQIGSTANGGSIIGNSASLQPTSMFSSSGSLATGGALAGAYGLYDAIANDREGIRGYGQAMASGAAIGFRLGGPVGAGIGAVAGGLAKASQDLFDSGKSRKQKNRDAFRDLIVERGIATRPEGGDDTLIDLFSGGQFDAGKDGKNRLTNADGTPRRYFEVDLTQPGIGDTISALDPLGTILAYQSGMSDQRENATGYLVNAVTSQGGTPEQTKNNILDMYRRSGYTPDQIDGMLGELKAAGKINDDQFTNWTNQINAISSGGQTRSINIGGGSAPAQRPQVDMSLLKAPTDPMAQTKAAYDKSSEQRLSLFPNQKTYQTLGAFQ